MSRAVTALLVLLGDDATWPLIPHVRSARSPSSTSRRHASCLTLRGFTERWRLSFEFMLLSIALFRQSKTDCNVLLNSILEIVPAVATAGVFATLL
jgi:hypothetical protein